MKNIFKDLINIILATLIGLVVLMIGMLAVKHIPIALGLFLSFLLGTSILDSIKK